MDDEGVFEEESSRHFRVCCSFPIYDLCTGAEGMEISNRFIC